MWPCHHDAPMMTSSKRNISALLALCEGNPPVDSPHKGQWRRTLTFSLIYAWTNGWANRDAGDFRPHLSYYDCNEHLVATTVWQCLVHTATTGWRMCTREEYLHYSDVIMSAITSQITSPTIVYSTVYSGTNQRKHHWVLWGEFPATCDRWIPRTKASNAENVSFWWRYHDAIRYFHCQSKVNKRDLNKWVNFE